MTPAQITTSLDSVSVSAGGSTDLTVGVLPENAPQDVTASVTDTNIASVTLK